MSDVLASVNHRVRVFWEILCISFSYRTLNCELNLCTLEVFLEWYVAIFISS